MLQTAEDIKILNEKISYSAQFITRITDELNKKIVGQETMIERLLIGLLSNGHVLLEGVPGLAKTLAIKSLSQTIHADFSRIQFTPDLLPADVIGTMIYNQGKNEFVVRKGPIFANFVLADEINRAPAKVQSALLEAMQERQSTIGDTSYKMPEPFLVLATQNPIEQEGTYPLPEAQVDRFMLKVIVGYPSKAEELLIIRQNTIGATTAAINAVASPSEIIAAKDLVRSVYIDEKPNKRWRSYSIASWPNGNNSFELCIVLNKEGKGTPYLFDEVKEGAELTLRGPVGVFTLPENIDKDVFLICTGTGIAPFRSMVHHIFNHNIPHKKIYLVFGCRKYEDALYADELKALAEKHPSLQFHSVFSRENVEENLDFTHKGYVHKVYESIVQSNKANSNQLIPATFYLCGWKQMVDEAKQRIMSLGYDRKSIHQELYG